MTEKNSFILYGSYYDAIRMLSDESRGKLLLAIYEYEIEGTKKTDLPCDAAVAFSFIRANLDRDDSNYREKCEKARASALSRYKKETAETQNQNKTEPDPEIKTQTQTENHPTQTENHQTQTENHPKKTEPEQTVRVNGDTKNVKYYGSMHNVALSEEEYADFRNKYPEKCEEKIERLSLFMSSSGRKYENHYATLCMWAQEDKKKENDMKKTASAEQRLWGDSEPSYDLDKAIRDSMIVPKPRKRGEPRHSEDLPASA